MSQAIIHKPEDKIERTESGSFFITPVADIWHDREGYTLEIEVPGVDRSGVEVSIEDGKLVVVGCRQSDRSPAGEKPLPRERGERKGYRRVFDLSPEVDASGIRASLEEGLLTLRVPKSERVQPRKIPIE
ncbi:Spore protein SP21 [Candidatus Xiphinematobacter sp. Idaho Grape]|uniref:Hsp20/alpha crystallin family protein n=1 Tax=Candidatus Xiphinematobacter sp. Idaho Grape TaxID=1704307 RepID=UPI0007064A76|nr:Hsp20/alpha crystallin family protein [Candidatus Xiphinematobacter sp. Idaho Grape]ALJ56821.1 Spore protein SP21 [Candidatus Xiphinematobacter sp. Idaho Grape]